MGRKNSIRRRQHAHKPARQFDKYEYYLNSVQAPDTDVVFMRDTYKELRKKKPHTLREDFCGTFSISCEWAKLNREHFAYGVDIDPEPLEYGRSFYLPQLTRQQQERVDIICESVLSHDLPKVDIIAAFNFSYFIFKERKILLDYFTNCYRTLNKEGLLVADCFGGSLCNSPNKEKTKHKGFIYEWEQESFDTITNHARYNINFKLDTEKFWRKQVFTYDWRMWSIPELKDIMADAGFKKTHVYWEQADASGEGTGDFIRQQTQAPDDQCDAWVAYVVGEK